MGNTLTISFTLWEAGVFLIAIGFLVSCVYVIRMIKGLVEVLLTTNTLINENRENIKTIVENASSMTEETHEMLKEVHTTVDTAVNDIANPIFESLAGLVNVLTKINNGKKKSKKPKKLKEPEESKES